MRIKVKDIHYHVEDIGKGEPLLLLHGFTGSGTDWKPFLKDWTNHFRVINVDLIGHGKSDVPKCSERYSMGNAVDDLHDLMDILKIESATVLGYSLGGRVSLSFAMTYPHRVNRLLLESSSPGLKTERERMERRANDERLARRIEDQGISAFVDYWESIPLFATQKFSEEEQANIHEERLNNQAIGLANSLRGMGTGAQPSWWSKLSTFMVSTTLIVGECDTKFCQIASDMEQLLPKCKRITVKEAGHTIHLEQTEKFATIVMTEIT